MTASKAAARRVTDFELKDHAILTLNGSLLILQQSATWGPVIEPRVPTYVLDSTCISDAMMHCFRMLLFLASVLEQLDLALEHSAKGDVLNARFGIMLTDNAVELVLHQIAKDKAFDLQSYSFQRKEYPHQDALKKALGRNFDAKVKFAKIEAGLTDEVAQTIVILHGYRNEVYHVELKHENILPALAVFYFDVASEYLSTHKPRMLSWGSNQKLPERAKKYFKGHGTFPGTPEDFLNGCDPA